MLKQKKLKKQLGEGYRFHQYRSPETVYPLLRSLTGRLHFVIAAALTVGVVKLEAILCWQGGRTQKKQSALFCAEGHHTPDPTAGGYSAVCV